MRIWFVFGLVSCGRGSGQDSALDTSGTDTSDPESRLSCVDPSEDAIPPPLYGEDDLQWRLVSLESELLEDAWAIVTLPTEGRSAYAEGLPVVVNVLVDTVYDSSYRTAPRPMLAPDLGVVEVQPLPPGWRQGEEATSGASGSKDLGRLERVHVARRPSE